MNDIFNYGMVLIHLKADVSDFEEGEVRTLACNYSLKELEEIKTIKLEKKEAFFGDYGINKNRDLFIYFPNGWRGCPSNKEKIYKFTECSSSTNCKDGYIGESKLEEKHQNILLGELIKRYDELPEFLKPKLKQLLNERK